MLALAGQAFSALQPPGSTFKVITATAASRDRRDQAERGVPGRDRRGRRRTRGLQRLQRVLRRHPARELRPLLQQRLRAARRPDRRRRAGQDGRAVRLQLAADPLQPPGAGPDRPPGELDPEDLRRATSISPSARSGRGRSWPRRSSMASASQAIADGRRPLPHRDRQGPGAVRRLPDGQGDVAPGRRRDEADDDRGRQLRHRRRRLAPRRPGGRQDRHRRARHDPRARPPTATEAELDVDAWFTAFAPADKPKLAVAVEVFNAPGDGGTVAAPIAAQILSAGL